MRFVETPVFTKELLQLVTEEDYRALQLALLFRPEQGRLIPGTGGLRKLRWTAGGRGKRGGCRIIYYWERKQQTIYMLFIYAKSKQEDLTPAQARMLSRLVREEFK
jgi:mRNA-degrading endonuclease RelE of RelBE toxin-antitoxin system